MQILFQKMDLYFCFQESQVTIECIIAQKHHRTVMGAKGMRVQGITAKYDVGIKFPDRNPNPPPPQGMYRQKVVPLCGRSIACLHIRFSCFVNKVQRTYKKNISSFMDVAGCFRSYMKCWQNLDTIIDGNWWTHKYCLKHRQSQCKRTHINMYDL